MNLLTQVLGDSGLQAGPDRIVAIGNNGNVGINALRRRIATLQNHLLLANRREWLVYEPDPLLFIAALFAVLSAGAHAIIPQNCQPHYIATLRKKRRGFIGHVGDSPIEADVSTRQICIDSQARLEQFSPDNISIGFCTSGSSGEPKIIRKELALLHAELSMFDHSWPTGERTLFIPLVSHMHIYGFTFACLWPLACRAPVLRYESPGILGALQQIPDHAVAQVDGVYIIAGPSIAKATAMIRRAAETNALSGEQSPLSVLRLFSAGGTLSSEAAVAMAAMFNCPVTDVLGSTETSAMASRMREETESKSPKWRAMPGVTIRADGVACGDDGQGELLAWGAHMGNAHGDARGEAVASGDEIIIASDGSFDLAGRIDRICKVEGKRVSLDYVDATLISNDLVCDAITFFQNGSKECIVALVALSESGVELLQREGREGCDRWLRRGLLSHMEAIAVPKRYRYVERIGRNAQGKFPYSELKKLLAPDAEQPILPEILATELMSAGIALSLHIPPDLLYLNGHFHSYPVVPGFILLHWVVTLSATQMHVQLDPARIDKLKFMRPVQPCTKIRLVLQESTNSVGFAYEKQSNEKFASGTVYKRFLSDGE